MDSYILKCEIIFENNSCIIANIIINVLAISQFEEIKQFNLEANVRDVELQGEANTIRSTLKQSIVTILR